MSLHRIHGFLINPKNWKLCKRKSMIIHVVTVSEKKKHSFIPSWGPMSKVCAVVVVILDFIIADGRWSRLGIISYHRYIWWVYSRPNSFINGLNFIQYTFTLLHYFKYIPSASFAINCSLPVAPRSIPALSISSLSNMEFCCSSTCLSVTWPTFIGRPASSKPFNCSNAFLASSASVN